MSIEPAGDVIRRIKRKYDEEREGWRLLAAADDQGRLDLFITSKEPRLWQLKSKPINPYEFLSLGAEVRNIDEEIRKEILMSGDPFLFHAVFPQTERGNIVARGVGQYSHESIKEIKRLASESDDTLDKELGRKLEELFKRMYPQRAQIYI